ncbi:MAG TPA: hypothetical protein VFV94_16640 [Polyangiaceae bacterium]|nr:hypothetical protein [Polyangiaceae bacterium]
MRPEERGVCRHLTGLHTEVEGFAILWHELRLETQGLGRSWFCFACEHVELEAASGATEQASGSANRSAERCATRELLGSS